ncbi:MAG: hypothetical protein ACD_84C00046G0002 [uncultured bacterium]|nr:MAG: hypothetical protein ACD_84C00046G0002 [uncultured bacterium]
MKATWLPLGGSNRITAPDVRRGETVVLYRFADSDEFFWVTLIDDFSLRKLETVVFAFSGTKVEGVKMDAGNTYFLEISTHSKMIHLHTSKANGEPYSYDIQLNTAEGFLQIQDDDGNFFKFDSADRHIVMVNRDQSKVEINKTIINFESSDEINMKTRKLTQTAQDVITKATNVNVTGSSQVRVDGGNFELATQTSSVI